MEVQIRILADARGRSRISHGWCFSNIDIDGHQETFEISLARVQKDLSSGRIREKCSCRKMTQKARGFKPQRGSAQIVAKNQEAHW